MTKSYLLFMLIVASTLVFIGCKKKETIITNEEELITTLKYTLTPTVGGTPVILTFRDLDGDGGNAPVITGGALLATNSYNGVLEILNESSTPVDTITNEITQEALDHQFFFQSTVPNLNITYNDQDANGKPLGLSTQLFTGTAGLGNLTITLRHQPNKSGTGVANGNITNAGGETDIEVTFPLRVDE